MKTVGFALFALCSLAMSGCGGTQGSGSLTGGGNLFTSGRGANDKTSQGIPAPKSLPVFLRLAQPTKAKGVWVRIDKIEGRGAKEKSVVLDAPRGRWIDLTLGDPSQRRAICVGSLPMDTGPYADVQLTVGRTYMVGSEQRAFERQKDEGETTLQTLAIDAGVAERGLQAILIEASVDSNGNLTGFKLATNPKGFDKPEFQGPSLWIGTLSGVVGKAPNLDGALASGSARPVAVSLTAKSARAGELDNQASAAFLGPLDIAARGVSTVAALRLTKPDALVVAVIGLPATTASPARTVPVMTDGLTPDEALAALIKSKISPISGQSAIIEVDKSSGLEVVQMAMTEGPKRTIVSTKSAGKPTKNQSAKPVTSGGSGTRTPPPLGR